MKLTAEQLEVCRKRFLREIRWTRLKKLNAPDSIMQIYDEILARTKDRCKELEVDEEMFQAFAKKFHVHYVAEELEDALRKKCARWMRYSQDQWKNRWDTPCGCLERNKNCSYDCKERVEATQEQIERFGSYCDIDTGESLLDYTDED